MIPKSIGEDFSLRLVVTKIDGVTVEDLSDAGWGLYFGIFAGKTSGTWSSALVQKTLGSGITKTDAVNGVCRIDVDDTDTDDWTPGNYYVCVKAISPLGLETDVIKAARISFTARISFN